MSEDTLTKLLWICLAGAMEGRQADVLSYAESYVFNSSKWLSSAKLKRAQIARAMIPFKQGVHVKQGVHAM